MASIARDKNGTRRILFVAPDGSRKTIRLGKLSHRAAEAVKFRVEQLLAAKLTGHAIEADTARWLAELEPAMVEKLARAGLVEKPEAKPAVTLGEYLATYFAKRTDVKSSTTTNWRHTKRCLLAYFGADRPLATITVGDARDWERWLRAGEARDHRYAEREESEGLAPNTVRKRVSNAKQFFQDAVNRELIGKNPFAGLKGSVGSNRERDHFIDRDASVKILAACPDAQWRLLFALSRFGGLRCPSEHLALTWADVDWAGGRFIVHSSKTAHHEGKATRVVPIFPELLPHLREAFELAEPGTVSVITRYRGANQNLRTTFEKIIHRAGLSPWPKLFQNLRASRATELANEYPAHVAAAWLGHSTLVANKHYWQVTDADFAKATTAKVGDQLTNERASAEAAQNPAQSAHETCGNAVQRETVAQQKSPVLSNNSGLSGLSENWAMGDEGPEPPVNSSEVTATAMQSGAESGALGARAAHVEAPSDSGLARVVEAWPGLSVATRQAILRLVEDGRG